MEQSRIIHTQEDRTLPTKMTDQDRDALGRQLASEVSELEAMDQAKKDWMTTFNSKRKKQAELVCELSDQVNTGIAPRLIRCDVVHDVYRKLVEIVRTDTMEVVESRAMTRAEYEHETQGELGY